MRILRATHLGMCFGVRDAIELALSQPEPVTVLGDLVHNETVLRQLRARGVRIERQPEAVTTPTVMITAHGASDKAKARVREHASQVLEATCPLVQHAHRAVRRLVAEGYHPVIIGQRDHVEVRGLTEDLAAFDVILNAADVARLPARQRYGIASQTTQPVERVRRLVALVRRTFPQAEVRCIDTICQPTKLRQNAAIQLAQHCDAVVVIGGANSNNTRELVATCADHCPHVYHVQTAADLNLEWFIGVETVGITAGTSTPDEVIDAVEQQLHDFAARFALFSAEAGSGRTHNEPALAGHEA